MVYVPTCTKDIHIMKLRSLDSANKLLSEEDTKSLTDPFYNKHAVQKYQDIISRRPPGFEDKNVI